MAKENIINKVGNALETVLKDIRKQFGEMSIMRLGDEAKRDMEAISTGSLSLDLALGIGGLPKGRIIELYGHESSGKTTLALHVAANAQSRKPEAQRHSLTQSMPLIRSTRRR